ncbi:hypothetical protein M8818_006393 [Zalaria obscura]|uniref:Uncharacterized protein n=1 Tax=Zalaria obscura TaxID=2024903 RepID=A0ACC3S7I5_9PEZI
MPCCQQYIGQACVTEWLLSSQSSGCCPHCRHRILPFSEEARIDEAQAGAEPDADPTLALGALVHQENLDPVSYTIRQEFFGLSDVVPEIAQMTGSSTWNSRREQQMHQFLRAAGAYAMLDLAASPAVRAPAAAQASPAAPNTGT